MIIISIIITHVVIVQFHKCSFDSNVFLYEYVFFFFKKKNKTTTMSFMVAEWASHLQKQTSVVQSFGLLFQFKTKLSFLFNHVLECSLAPRMKASDWTLDGANTTEDKLKLFTRPTARFIFNVTVIKIRQEMHTWHLQQRARIRHLS